MTADDDLKCPSLDRRRTFNRLNGSLQDILTRNSVEYNKFRASIIYQVDVRKMSVENEKHFQSHCVNVIIIPCISSFK